MQGTQEARGAVTAETAWNFAVVRVQLGDVNGRRVQGVLVPAAEGVPAARQGASAKRRGRTQVSAHQIPRECVVARDTRPCCRQAQQHP